MSLISKKMLDKAIDLDHTKGSEERYIWDSRESQIITGAKTMTTPPQGTEYAYDNAQAVNKKTLMEMTRCLGYDFTEEFVVDQTQIDNGYVQLANEIALKNKASVTMEMDGAGYLVEGRDYSADVDNSRLVWSSLPLGSRIQVGDRVVCTYAICKDEIKAEDRIPRPGFCPEIWHSCQATMNLIGDSQSPKLKHPIVSGKKLRFVNVTKKGVSAEVTLPEITGDGEAYLTSAGGNLFVYSLPTTLLPTVDNDKAALKYPYFENPNVRIYKYDELIKTWTSFITYDMTPEFEAVKEYDFLSVLDNALPLIVDVIPVGEYDIGILWAYNGIAYLRVYDGFTGKYERTDSLGSFNPEQRTRPYNQLTTYTATNRGLGYGGCKVTLTNENRETATLNGFIVDDSRLLASSFYIDHEDYVLITLGLDLYTYDKSDLHVEEDGSIYISKAVKKETMMRDFSELNPQRGSEKIRGFYTYGNTLLIPMAYISDWTPMPYEQGIVYFVGLDTLKCDRFLMVNGGSSPWGQPVTGVAYTNFYPSCYHVFWDYPTQI